MRESTQAILIMSVMMLGPVAITLLPLPPWALLLIAISFGAAVGLGSVYLKKQKKKKAPDEP